MIVPILLCGGSGTRLWPVSRKSYPKQFVYILDSELSLLQETAKRFDNLDIDHSGWMVVANHQHRFMLAEQLNDIDAHVDTILLEPMGRNTAAAIAIAAFEALSKFPDAQLLVQTADHVIPDIDLLHDAVNIAYDARPSLCTFGIKPTRPETGYGYIKKGESLNVGNIFTVDAFIEKPDAKVASDYISSGNYLWNSGMFLLDATLYLSELNRLEPDIFSASNAAWERAIFDQDFKWIDEPSFSISPSKSIDIAVMERTDKALVTPFEGMWLDLGSWDSVAKILPSDQDGNTVQGDGMLQDCSNTYVRSQSRFVAAIGLNNTAVIETPDSILIASLDSAQGVKELVIHLQEANRSEAESHVIEYRPWGSFESILIGDQFQVKRIIVKPGSSLSLQKHHKRAEHWILVEGEMLVRNGDEEFTLSTNESTYIPIGAIHRATNPGKKPAVFIEVQTGSYLGEDDIVRLEDNYGRA